MPHRDVVAEKASIEISAFGLVSSFLENSADANQKYLDNVVEITGTVKSVKPDQLQQIVILLKEDGQLAGISCTFTSETSPTASELVVGSKITIKGIVRAGATYDADMDLYENVVVEKCSL
jgi:hypothetical protein